MGESGATGVVGGQRAFTFVRSRFAGRRTYLLRGKGWHEPEEEGWRWTEQHFAVRFEGIIRCGEFEELFLSLFLPQSLIDRFGCLMVSACANGIDLLSETLSAAGPHLFRRNLSDVPLFGGEIRIDFSTDCALPPDSSDGRERAIIVKEIRLVPKGAQDFGPATS